MDEQTCTKCGWAGMVTTCLKCGGEMKPTEAPKPPEPKKKVTIFHKKT